MTNVPGNTERKQRNRFSLSHSVPASGWAAVHLMLISNWDQKSEAGRQTSLHRQQRQFWRFARWLSPHNKLQVFAKLVANQAKENECRRESKLSAITRSTTSICSYEMNLEKTIIDLIIYFS